MFLFTLVLHLSTDFTRSTTRKSVTQIPATASLMTLTRPFVTTTPAGMNCFTLWLRATRAMRASATHEPSASSSSSLSWLIWPSPSHGSEVFILHLSPHLHPGLSGRHQAMEVKSLSSTCLLMVILPGPRSLHLQPCLPHLYPGLSGHHQAMEVKSLSSTCLLMVILPGHRCLHLQPRLPCLYPGLFGHY